MRTTRALCCAHKRTCGFRVTRTCSRSLGVDELAGILKRAKATGTKCVRADRHYFPKHTDLARHSAGDLERVALELNQRPRLVLDDLTPEHALARLTATTHTP